MKQNVYRLALTCNMRARPAVGGRHGRRYPGRRQKARLSVQVKDVVDFKNSPHYDDRQKAALAYAGAHRHNSREAQCC
jgi:hypothetical protein